VITPSRANVKAFLGKIRTMVKGYKQARAGHLVLLLNQVIRGWALYYRHQASKATLHAVDHAILWALWRWAKRRHRNKSNGWMRAKYFKTQGTRHWVFTDEGTDARGRRRIARLLPASSMSIRRHGKIHPGANPYDPAWAGYFARRHGVQTAQLLTGQYRALALWDEQNGRCLLCRQPLLLPDGWHSHHLVWRSHGGSDAASNRVLLHPTCHQQVHSRGLTVEKPRPSRGVESGLSRVTGNWHARF
jgi:RNA-directed DNA polymerase